jgi:N-acetyltransferase
MSEHWVQPVTLEGTAARLEPVAEHHADGLLAAAGSPEIWRYMPANLADEAALHGWIGAGLAEREAGTAMVFAIIDRASGAVAGSTRYMTIDAANRGLEIGWTWLGPTHWRSPINTECKFLLLRHAFEELGAIRVQLKTHRLNQRSRRAIERIGAQFEGILRNHYLLADGTYRDSAYYSVIESEWPAVRRHLRGLMDRSGALDG